MLPKNIFNINKIISFLSIILLLSSVFIVFMQKETKATYDSKFKNYPKYAELIENLQKAHPNWEFEILETGLDWYDTIIAESIGNHKTNVVDVSKGSEWKCSCGMLIDGGRWACASTAAVAYYMDPRNSLNEEYVFQFENLTYDPTLQNEEGVKLILKDCSYMQGKITYLDSAGNKKTIDKTYSQVIMEAATEYKVSPYHLASRIRQEHGTSGSTLIGGKYKGYEGLYNYFNIGAFGKTDAEVIQSGLMEARKQQWTDPEKAIKGGAKFIANDYISIGQDTLYLQKFNVVYEKSLYSHQYMQNVSATMTEGNKVRQAYKEIGILDNVKIKFKIPVYKNMPEQVCSQPGLEQIVTQDVQITENDVIVRNGKGTDYSVITTLKKGSKILRIELDKNKDKNGRYWDKVVLQNGTKGYISREYLEQISIQSNANETYIVTAWTNFRNGPGTKGGTTVIKQLPPDQIVTVVEKGKYPNVDAEAWYRVRLADGTYGYVGTGFIAPYVESKPEVPNTSSGENTGSTGDGNNQGQETVSPTMQGNGYKVIEDNFICKPEMTVEEMKKELPSIIIQDANKNDKSEGSLATGFIVTYEEKTYTVVVLGDINGDGKVNTGDTLCISQHIENFKKITVDSYLKAADVNQDEKLNTGDSLVLRQHVENFRKIVF